MAALLVGVLATACANLSNAAVHTAPDGKKEVTIGKAVDTVGFTTVDVAQAKGYFAKEGVTAKQELLGGSSTAFAALQSGSVQFVTASSTALLSAKTKRVPLQAVASLDYGVSLQLAASKSWVKDHHLSANQPLKTVMKGLTGSTLGVVSTTDLTYYHYLMKQAGVKQDQFKTIVIKTQAAALAAVQHGQIDAILLSPPNSYLAQAQGQADIIASLHSVPALKNMAYDVLVVSSRFAKAHPDVVKAVATGMARADNTMAKDPRSVLDVERKHYPKMSDDVLMQSLTYVTFAPDGKMSAAGWEGVRDEAKGSDVPDTSSVNLKENQGTWTNDYIDTERLHTPAPSSSPASESAG
ncbi:ABC transporter substrate-binding protein [Streptomyces sp. 8L]|uniref:ABC transporter substrate-binding protein n=1 Tax=Streptomyces sp. 8L TaxID=2877242 RepID=UPI001CD6386C|nr:ABC transporter substrate-binding protein [Streptomyces sp. 8L]MCA1218550.1 ABC transporter substrate-binding protein [Streptomyces sp. 8L]